MGFLEDYLANYAPLLQAATGTGVPSPTGGTPAPGGGGPDNLAPPNPPADPVQALMLAYKAYQKAGPGDRPRRDSLLTEARRGYAQGTPSAPSDIRLLAGGKPRVTKSGPRAGSAYFGLEREGQKFSVRYDEKGKRKVYRW